MVARRRVPGPEPGYKIEVEGTFVSYRTITFNGVLGLIGAGFVFYLTVLNHLTGKAKGALNTLTPAVAEDKNANGAGFRCEPCSVNVDATVRVKKTQSPQWICADYRTNLATGDFIQTGSDRMAGAQGLYGWNLNGRPWPGPARIT